MGYIPDQTIAALQGSYNLGIFVRLGTAPPLHLSFGINDVPMVMPGLDDPATIYTGGGLLQNVPSLETLINGIADTVTFTVDGLNPASVALMFDSAPEILGSIITVGIAPMTQKWQPATSIALLWTGVADVVTESMAPETNLMKNRTQSISITASTGNQARQFQNLTSYSDAVQQSLSPGDLFCSRTPLYINGYTVSWPRF